MAAGSGAAGCPTGVPARASETSTRSSPARWRSSRSAVTADGEGDAAGPALAAPVRTGRGRRRRPVLDRQHLGVVAAGLDGLLAVLQRASPARRREVLEQERDVVGRVAAERRRARAPAGRCSRERPVGGAVPAGSARRRGPGRRCRRGRPTIGQDRCRSTGPSTKTTRSSHASRGPRCRRRLTRSGSSGWAKRRPWRTG